MALPKLNTPTYSLVLPSTGEEVKFRPFLVKEQKLLMLAQESENNKEMLDTVVKIVSSCTFNKVDPTHSPLFDIEYVFLKLRAKSVGENVEVTLLCPDDEETYTTKKINLDEIEIEVDESHSNEIQLTEQIKLIMKYPQMSDMNQINTQDNSQINLVFSVLKHCILEVQDGDTSYQKVDISDKDLEEFIDSFDTEQFEKIMTFFETMPKLREKVEVTNPKTQVTSEIVLEGLESFLG
tara:strand:- start:461 stop:1171 length:711 start_codon:yes stop_codon:yes gene_type:complete